MACPTAETLFQDYARATPEYFELADNLAAVVGKHNQLDKAKKEGERVRQRCRTAKLAFEQHRALHGCGLGDSCWRGS